MAPFNVVDRHLVVLNKRKYLYFARSIEKNNVKPVSRESAKVCKMK